MIHRVLIVDDDKEIVSAIAKLLEPEGIEAVRCYNGIEAVEALCSTEVHLIIIDIMMPEMDGISATIKIRNERNIPIIMLSAKAEESDKILGLSVGADDYVTKPFSPSELVARVKSQLRRYMALGVYSNRAASKAYRKGIQHSGASDGKRGESVLRGGNLRESMERNGFFGREYGHGTYPPYQGENRNKSE